MEIAILALGCFWGPEQKFSKIDGIIRTEVGYCGGNTENTNYKDVCTGTTNHAEVVKLEYDEKTITYEDILKYFFEFHDPTTFNSQGYDFGTQYRSEIFYLNEKQKMSAEKMIEAENKKLNGKVVTQLSLLKNYCTAEEYHQKYLDKKF
ncbi:MAG: peptide-methionine (S)-S-oxide reductase MsrA [Candidatus Pelagibacter sp.]